MCPDTTKLILILDRTRKQLHMESPFVPTKVDPLSNLMTFQEELAIVVELF